MLLILTTLNAAFAGDPTPEFTPHIQLKPRVEAHTGRDGTAGEGDTLFVGQRTRLGGTLEMGPVAGTVLLQDVRMWGSETNTLTDFSADFMDAHLAHVIWSMSDDVALTVGRQEFDLHEQRLIGAVDWTFQGRSFDGARLAAKSGALSADLGAFLLREGDLVDSEARDDGLLVLRAGWAKKDKKADKKPANQADLVAIVERLGDQDVLGTPEVSRNTVGVYAKGKNGILSGRVEGYYQLGNVGQGDASIGAYMAGLSGTVAPEAKVEPTITLWYDHLSGDDDVADDQIKAFNTLYATNHKFYGHIDIAAFGTGAMVDGRGLQDAALKFGLKPAKGLKVNLDLHALLPANAQGGDSSIAQEADVWAAYAISKHLKLAGGAAVWLPSTDADPDTWGWLQLDAQL